VIELLAPEQTAEGLAHDRFFIGRYVRGHRAVKLIGFGPSQIGLFPADVGARDRVRDAIAERFGDGALTRASLLPAPGEEGAPAADRKGSRRLRR